MRSKKYTEILLSCLKEYEGHWEICRSTLHRRHFLGSEFTPTCARFTLPTPGTGAVSVTECLLVYWKAAGCLSPGAEQGKNPARTCHSDISEVIRKGQVGGKEVGDTAERQGKPGYSRKCDF